MTLIKTIMVGFMIFGIILMVMFSVVGNMNTNYGQNNQMDNKSTDYLNKVSNFSTSLKNSVRAGDIATSVPVIGQMVAGGIIAANIFTIAIVQVPMMAESTINYLGTSLGIGEYANIIYVLVFALIILSVIRFLMGREL